MPPKKSAVILATAGACACFFALGFVDNLKGVALPAVLQELSFRLDQAGAVLAATYMGMLVSTLLSGALCDLIGPRRVAFIGSGLLAAGVLGYSTARSYWMLFASMLVLGLMIGTLLTAGTNLIIAFHPARRGRYLNLVNIFHATASMLAPFYSRANAGGRNFLAAGLPTVPGAGGTGGGAFPGGAGQPGADRRPTPTPPANRERSLAALYRSVLTRRLARYYALDLLYVAAETGILVWLVEFLQRARGQSIALSSSFLSLYFIFIIVGRLAGSLVVDRLGYPPTLVIASAGALACLGLGTFGPPALVWLLPLSGFFLSAYAPTLAAAVSVASPHTPGSALGVMFATASLGGILGAWSAGFVAEALTAGRLGEAGLRYADCVRNALIWFGAGWFELEEKSSATDLHRSTLMEEKRCKYENWRRFSTN